MVGKKETIVKAHPYRVIEYSMQNEKNKNMFTNLKMWIAATIVMKPDVIKEIKKNTMNHERK